MQSRKMSGMMVRWALVVGTLVFSLLLFGCPSDDEDDDGDGGGGGGGGVVDVRTRVALSTVNSATLNDLTFTLGNGGVFHADLAGDSVRVTFQDFAACCGGLITLQSGGFTAEGGVAVTAGIMTITWTSSNFPRGRGPQAGGTVQITDITLRVTAANVPVGDEAGIRGELLLQFVNRNFGDGVAVSVSVDDQGNLFVNSNLVGVDIDITGASGGGN